MSRVELVLDLLRMAQLQEDEIRKHERSELEKAVDGYHASPRQARTPRPHPLTLTLTLTPTLTLTQAGSDVETPLTADRPYPAAEIARDRAEIARDRSEAARRRLLLRRSGFPGWRSIALGGGAARANCQHGSGDGSDLRSSSRPSCMPSARACASLLSALRLRRGGDGGTRGDGQARRRLRATLRPALHTSQRRGSVPPRTRRRDRVAACLPSEMAAPRPPPRPLS